MSAFIVSDKTLQDIVSFLDLDARFSNTSRCYGSLGRILLKQGFNMELQEHKDRLIKEMTLLNRLGVNTRYDEHETEHNVKYADQFAPSIFQAYKSLGCFLYQCCEGDIPETNSLYKMFESIKSEIAECIVSSLPEYEKAQWGH